MNDKGLSDRINGLLAEHMPANPAARPHVVLIDTDSGTSTGPWPRIAFRRGSMLHLAYRAVDGFPKDADIVRLLRNADITGNVRVSVVVGDEGREHWAAGSSGSSGAS